MSLRCGLAGQAHLAVPRPAKVPEANEHAALYQTDQPPEVQLEAGFVLERECARGHRVGHNSECLQGPVLGVANEVVVDGP